MHPELWKKVDALLDQALAQPPDKREEFVAEAAKDDPALRDEVLSLLKAGQQASHFMEHSAIRAGSGGSHRPHGTQNSRDTGRGPSRGRDRFL
jgi:hypothetical protein